ncbi:MAG: GNAT family N-acetyltransferase, partial [Actinomycetota bacterium]
AGRRWRGFQLARRGGTAGADGVVAPTTLVRDDAVAEVAAAAGRPVVRGSERDVLSRFVAAADAYPTDHVVRLTADCPLTDPELVVAVIEHHVEREADYTSNVFPRTFPKGLDVEVLQTSTLRAADAEATDGAEREHVTPFVYRRPERFRLANLRNDEPLGDEWWTVDTASDLETVRDLVARMGDDRFGWRDAWKLVVPRFTPPVDAPHLVPAGPEHCAFFLACRNDEDAVRWSRSGRAVTIDEHKAWYRRAISDPGLRLRIAEYAGAPIATVRVDIECGVGEVGVALAPQWRGRGLGALVLRALHEDVLADPQVAALVARIHPQNVPSRRAFAGVGFVADDGADDGFDVLTWSREAG